MRIEEQPGDGFFRRLGKAFKRVWNDIKESSENPSELSDFHTLKLYVYNYWQINENEPQ